MILYHISKWHQQITFGYREDILKYLSLHRWCLNDVVFCLCDINIFNILAVASDIKKCLMYIHIFKLSSGYKNLHAKRPWPCGCPPMRAPCSSLACPPFLSSCIWNTVKKFIVIIKQWFYIIGYIYFSKLIDLLFVLSLSSFRFGVAYSCICSTSVYILHHLDLNLPIPPHLL